MISTGITITITFMSAFSPNIWTYVVSRFVVGFCYTGCGTQGFIMLIERAGQIYLASVAILYWIASVFACMIFPIISYNNPN